MVKLLFWWRKSTLSSLCILYKHPNKTQIQVVITNSYRCKKINTNAYYSLNIVYVTLSVLIPNCNIKQVTANDRKMQKIQRNAFISYNVL
jgi:hypothetical protein